MDKYFSLYEDILHEDLKNVLVQIVFICAL